MIKNDRQLAATKSHLKRFNDAAIILSEKLNSVDKNTAWILDAQIDAIHSQMSDLEEDIRHYELLRNREIDVSPCSSIEDIPRYLIEMRIYNGLTQRKLAEILGLKEQQIQRYESINYQSVSLKRLKGIADALKARYDNALDDFDEREKSYLVQRLANVGIKSNFAIKRLLPGEHKYEGGIKTFKKNLSSIINSIRRIFGWGKKQLLSNDPLIFPIRLSEAPSFKYKGDSSEVDAYIVYVHYLSMLTLQGMKAERTSKISSDPEIVFNEIMDQYGGVSLLSVLRYIWNKGVPVLPLGDPGLFHGACFRINGKNVIVLKQKSRSIERWLFDLLHELYHVSNSDGEENTIILDFESSDGRLLMIEEDIEKRANWYAGWILFGGRADDLAEKAILEAKGNLRLLKRAVELVATKESISPGLLANYVAHRLQAQGYNWWGTANNLQNTSENPILIATDFFLRNVELSDLNELDRHLLMKALDNWEE